MDKSKIKEYAIWARQELIKRVAQKAAFYGITENNIVPGEAESVNGRVLSAAEKKQRTALIHKIQQDGFQQTMEEIAYTWFNRFIALRFMEVNDYLPSHIRVFTNEEGEFKPQIMTEALSLNQQGLDREKIYALKDANKDDELFKYLIITQCNALSSVLPGMFQTITDYTELLFPDYLLREESVIGQMVARIPENDWKDQVQIIGWLYQYYNTEPKDKVFGRKSGEKIEKEDIPAATQLFTPDWIVRYMVENSLGRLWLAGHPDQEIQKKWRYYVPEAKQEPEVQKELEELNKKYAQLQPEDLTVIDPCCGSGHILVYVFDVLMQIYQSQGYAAQDAAVSIVKNNLFGLDIDRRAAQLSYFSVMMKARQYDRRFFLRGIQPHVYDIEESNGMTRWSEIRAKSQENELNLDDHFVEMADYLIDTFHDAKIYGSLLQVRPDDYDGLLNYVNQMLKNESTDLFLSKWLQELRERMIPLIEQAKLLSHKYYCCVTNPPYMGRKNMCSSLSEFVTKQFSDYKSDLFSAFMVRCTQLTDKKGYLGFLSPYVWMFISSYEKLREFFIHQKTIQTLIQFEYSAFEEATVPICTFVLQNSHIAKKGVYFRLVECKGGMEVQRRKMLEELVTHSPKMYFEIDAENFDKISGSPLAYWASSKIRDAFKSSSLYDKSVSPSQNVTGNNEKFIRKHWELEASKIGGKDSWIFYCKGGGYRKWWGYLYDVINWTPRARYIYQHGDGKHASQIINHNYWYKKGITWGLITSKKPSFRIMPKGATYDKGGSTIIVDENIYNFILGLLNSSVFIELASILNPTLNYQVKDVRLIPVILEHTCKINEYVDSNIILSKADWNSFETSWDFTTSPLLINYPSSLKQAYEYFKQVCMDRFQQLKHNEEELNRIFINIYGLQDELTPDESDRDVTVYRVFDTKDDVPESMKGSNYALTKQDVIKSFISYAVGCMLGRYSLDTEGLAYAGGDWDASKYQTFQPDEDNILPITDDEDYFRDDIVSRFVQFVKAAYGEDTLEENLSFIAEALGNKGHSSRDVIRNYFLKDFFKDHCKTYKKRPIYWLFDSGKKNGFKCLIYMHRYQPDTIARIRTDYVLEQQSKYRTAIEDLERQINAASTPERVRLNKQLGKLKGQAEELRVYEEKIHHLADQMISINLDDGVKHNYAIFQDVLAEIK